MNDTDSGRLSLRSLIFVLSALLVVLVVGVSVAISVYKSRIIGEQAVSNALSRSQATQDYFDELRYRQLELITQIFASDPYFAGYISDAFGTSDDLFAADEGGVDEASIADLLEERRQSIGFDVAMVLDVDGLLVAHTGRSVEVDEYVDHNPQVALLIEDLIPVTGLWQEGEQIFQVAMVPLTEGEGDLIGFLIAGLRVSQSLVDEIKTATNTELIFYSDAAIIASTLPDAYGESALQQLLAAPDLESLRTGSVEAISIELSLAERPWVAGVTLLDDSTDPVVLAISLIGMDAVLADYRSMQRTLVVVGAAMVVVGLLISLLLARRVVVRPLDHLAAAATAASRGDYDQRLAAAGSDEVVRLGVAFNTLLSDLREKRDMENFVTDLYRYLPEPGVEEATVQRTETHSGQAEHKMVALLGLDYRQVAQQSGDARAHIADLERRLIVAEGVAKLCGGRIESVMGSRALLGFEGEEAALVALACAGELSRRDDQELPMALVYGEADRGSIRTGALTTGVVLGKPIQQLDLLLEEARPGQLLLAPTVKDALIEVLDEPRPAVVAGRVSGRRYYALDAAALGMLPGVEDDGAGVDSTPVDVVSEADQAVRPGDVFADRYEILSVLGSGGMGMVFKALDRELQDFVALKTLLPDIASDGRYLEQMKEEIKLARKITHVNVLRTFDFGSHEGTAYISMEYVRGMTLRYLLEQRGKLPYSAGLRIARQLCGGLGAAHLESVVHRDVKPENLILRATGEAKLMDFGIARPLAAIDADDTEGVFIGTPRYAAPEQMEGRQVTSRADVFACGVLMYEMFTGETPFPGDELMEIYTAKVQGSARPPTEAWPEIPPELARIIQQCLARSTDERFGDANELGEALSGLRA